MAKGMKKKSIRGSRAGDGTAKVLAGHYRMLSDPCGAEITPSAFGGRNGYPQRLSGFNYVSVPANGACLFAWHPGAGNVTFSTAADASVNFTPTWGTTNNGCSAPIGALPTISDDVRCLAACLEVTYVGTELDRSGAMGVLAGHADSVVRGGVVTNVISKMGIANEFGRTPKDTIEIKWVPAELDQQYTNLSDAPTNFFGDRTAIGFALIAGDKAVAVRLRLTVIYEFLPKSGSGMPLPTVQRNIVGGYERLVNAAFSNPHFISNMKRAAESAYTVARAVMGSNSFKQLTYKAAPLLLKAALP